MKIVILHPILGVIIMVTSSLAVIYVLFNFVKYDPLPSDVIQATPKYHHPAPVQLHTA
jgi:hypothetical protein